MTRLLKCQKCGDFTDRLINYDDHDICLDCFVDRLKAVFDNNNKEYPTDLRQRCSMSFFNGRVNGKDSSKAPYRKRKDESSDGNLYQ